MLVEVELKFPRPLGERAIPSELLSLAVSNDKANSIVINLPVYSMISFDVCSASEIGIVVLQLWEWFVRPHSKWFLRFRVVYISQCNIH